MAKVPEISIKKEQMLIILLSVLVLIVLAVVVKDLIIPKIFKSSVAEGGPTSPPFLSVPLPSIDRIKQAADNPKIDELKFYRPIFIPEGEEGQPPAEGEEPGKPPTLEDLARKVKVEKLGRPNPFIPFEGFKLPE